MGDGFEGLGGEEREREEEEAGRTEKDLECVSSSDSRKILGTGKEGRSWWWLDGISVGVLRKWKNERERLSAR